MRHETRLLIFSKTCLAFEQKWLNEWMRWNLLTDSPTLLPTYPVFCKQQKRYISYNVNVNMDGWKKERVSEWYNMYVSIKNQKSGKFSLKKRKKEIL